MRAGRVRIWSEGEPQGEARAVVDDRVLRRILQINPAFRDGRTTGQIKKNLERGGALASGPATAGVTSGPSPGAASATDRASLLRQTIDFFLGHKQETWQERCAAFDQRRRAIDREQHQLQQALGQQVLDFVALLDSRALAAHGERALRRHAPFLTQLELTPQAVLPNPKRQRRKK